MKFKPQEQMPIKIFPISQLSEEQQNFINEAKQGKNILVDACIGSGKTTAIQVLCNELKGKQILYLTYNRLLKIDAQSKIINSYTNVNNYHGFAWQVLARNGVKCGIGEIIQTFNKYEFNLPTKYDILIIDEYQDIEQELADMLLYIKSTNPNMQIVAVGDMAQKIYDKTNLDVMDFMNDFLGDYVPLNFTKCFRINADLAKRLSNIWQKPINGVNSNCKVEYRTVNEVIDFLAKQDVSNILCLGARTGTMSKVLNILEKQYPNKFNKQTVYASITDEDRTNTAPSPQNAIFTTFDSSKGLERSVCCVFDFTEDYWESRAGQSMQKYEILRNIFCVAASRGKDRIIFVEDRHEPLSDYTLSTPFKTLMNTRPFYVSDMFSFKYVEDIEACYNLLDITKLSASDNEIIKIETHDELIDLSPCIGIYQEAMFFKNYDIDDEIKTAEAKNDKRYPIRLPKYPTLAEKVLYLVAYETYYDRYLRQVTLPFINDGQEEQIKDRLSNIFDSYETVQQDCSFEFIAKGTAYKIKGRCDVLKDDIVYELKFVNELTHDHFLQCALYVVLFGLEKGILWNIRNNRLFEVKVPDRRAFMKQVIKTITKGQYKNSIFEIKKYSDFFKLSQNSIFKIPEVVVKH